MSDDAARAAQLRIDFDRGFAMPPAPATTPGIELLACRLAGQRYAIALADLAGVIAGRRIVAVPTAVAALAGVAAVRGALVGVYDLRTILGLPAPGVPRWIARLATEPSVAVAIDEVDGYLHARGDDVAHAGDSAGGHVRATVCDAGGDRRAIVDLGSVLAAIRGWATPGQER